MIEIKLTNTKNISYDFEHLRDSEKWLRRVTLRIPNEKIKDPIILAIRNLLTELSQNPNLAEHLILNIVTRTAEVLFLSDLSLTTVLTFPERKEIEACFIASILRFFLLQNPNPLETILQEFDRKVHSEYAAFLFFTEKEADPSSVEYRCLFRFEQAIILVKKYISGHRHKGLLLTIGNLLEGSEDFIRYITGGRSTKETSRRVKLIEHLYGIIPKARATSKGSVQATSSPSSFASIVSLKRKRSTSNSDSAEETQPRQKVSKEATTDLSDALSCLVEVAARISPSLSPHSSHNHSNSSTAGSTPTILQSEVFQQREAYLLFFRYQKALSDENIPLATELWKQLHHHSHNPYPPSNNNNDEDNSQNNPHSNNTPRQQHLYSREKKNQNQQRFTFQYTSLIDYLREYDQSLDLLRSFAMKEFQYFPEFHQLYDQRKSFQLLLLTSSSPSSQEKSHNIQ